MSNVGGGNIHVVKKKPKKGRVGKTEPDHCGLCLKCASLIWRGKRRSSILVMLVLNGLIGNKDVLMYAVLPACRKDVAALL